MSVIVSFQHPSSISEITYLTAAVTAADTTIYVRDTEGLSQNDYIILGATGNEGTEIVQINATVSSKTSLTITAASYNHSIDDLVSYIPYNKIQHYSSTTKSGSKITQGSAVDIDVNDLVTETLLASVTSGYVYARFYNSTSGAYSSYSPAIPVSGFTENSLRYIIDSARLRTQELTDKLVSDDDLLEIARECADEIETIRKNWSFVQDTDYITLTAGVSAYAKPSNLAGPESIERVLLTYDNGNLNYYDNKEYWYRNESIPQTETTAQITAASTTISVRDTSAFGTTGTITISGDTSIYYTGKTNKSFTGVTGIGKTITAYAQVFNTADLDQPTAYSFWNENILFYPTPDKFYNVRADFYRTIGRMTDVSVETVVTMPHLFIWHMMSEIFVMRDDTKKGAYWRKRFETGLKLLAKKNRNFQILKMQPATSYMRQYLQTSDDLAQWREHGSS